MDLQQLLDQRIALADAFDARVTELHTQPAPATMPGATAIDALALLDQTVQQQWQQVQGVLDGQARPARPAFRAPQGPAEPADVVDVNARELRAGG